MPPPVLLPFAIQSYKHDSKPAAVQRCVNAYAEKLPPRGSKADVAVVACPGTVEFATCGSGPVRGFVMMNDVMHVLSGAFLYSVTSAGVVTTLGGSVSGSSVVGMAVNELGEIVIVNGVNGYLYSAALGFTLITDTDFFAAYTVAYMDSFFLFEQAGSNNVFKSASLNGSSYSATDISAAESKPDDVVAVFNYAQRLYVFGASSIEPWANYGTANFPFRRIQGSTIERGIAGPRAVVGEDNSPFFIGEDRIAYRINGDALTRISQHAVEQAWQNYTTVSDVSAVAYTFDGHKFIYFNFPNGTWGFDIATGLWHERESRDIHGNNLGRWRGNCAIAAYNKVMIGDAFTGKIAYLSRDVATEFDGDIVVTLAGPPVHANGKRMFMSKLRVDIETGVGLTSGQGSNPQIMLRYSDDGGQTYSTFQPWASMGKKGEYMNWVEWQKLGSFYERIYELQISDPVRKKFMFPAKADASVGL